MDTRVNDNAVKMKSETVGALQDLVRALNDSAQYHLEAADKIESDERISNELRQIAADRKYICENVSSYITLANEDVAADGTFTGTMRKIWTAFRAGLNSGDATVVLIEAERAEDVILQRFRRILPEIAGNPINDKLNQFFNMVKVGHDRILALRNSYQAK
jgi:uncharacterized protein (TIGR02284 family)